VIEYLLFGTGGGVMAGGTAYLYYKGEAAKAAIKGDIKKLPAAVDAKIEQTWESAKLKAKQKAANVRLDVKTVTDQNGYQQHVNVNREVVDLTAEIEQFEKMKRQINKNPNRGYDPGPFTGGN